MVDPLAPFDLDQEIRLGARVTTIRAELMGDNAHTLRSFVSRSENPKMIEYFVMVDKQPNNSEMFKITKQDFDYLLEQGIRPAFS